MPKITDGKIIYGDGVKGEEFGPIKKAEAHLTFVLDEAEDAGAAIEQVVRHAIAQVNKMIGKAVTAAEGDLKIVETKPSGKDAVAAKEAAKAAEQKPEIVDKKKPGKPAAAKKTDAAAVVEEPAEDASAVTDESASSTETTDASVIEDDPAAVEDTGEVSFDIPAEVATTTEITDADLNSAVQKKNGEINDPVAIKKLIATYKTDPAKAFQLREIPQDKRQEFLDKLADLKKA